MDIQKLKLLLKQSEGTKLDFKESLRLNTETDKKEFAKDIIAIANSIGGRGYLIVGVKDKSKEIVGIDLQSFHEERIQQIISNRCEPPISIRVESVQYDDKYIGIITVFKSSQRPHQMRQTGAFYIRRGSTTDFARREEIASFFQEAGIISNELVPLYNLDVSVLNREQVQGYLNKINLHPDKNLEREVWRNLGIIYQDGETGKYYPTVGGILLFGKDLHLYLPYCGIKVISFQDKEKTVQYIHGNVFQLLSKSHEYISRCLETIFYPKEAIFEGIANAIIHRDYFDISREIVVILGHHTVEISNPGTLPRGQNMHTIMRDSNPTKRNNWLYQKLLILDEEKRLLKTGFGLRNIHQVFKGSGTVKFLNIEKRNLFKIILPGLKYYKAKKEGGS